MTYSIHYETKCTNCDSVQKSSDVCAFVSPFCMPDYCSKCGEWRSHEVFGNKDWETVTIKQKWVKPKFKLLVPTTWFGYWKEVK